MIIRYSLYQTNIGVYEYVEEDHIFTNEFGMCKPVCGFNEFETCSESSQNIPPKSAFENHY